MQVSEATQILQNSALKQLAVKDDQVAVMGFINMAILEIYKRFPLWEADAVITQADGVSIYNLTEADPNVSIDLSDNQLMVIQSVYDEDGIPYVINNNKDPVKHIKETSENPRSILQTPKYNQIKVKNIVPGYQMDVVYRAAPLFLTEQEDEIPLPPQFNEALFLYVSYKAHLGVKAGIKDENNTHFIRFEASCNNVDTEGLFPQQGLESNKFEQRGFV